MVLHSKSSQGPVVIHSDDTDVFMLLLGHLLDLPQCFMKIGKGAKTRVIDVNAIKSTITSQYDIKRANYQARIWRKALVPKPTLLSKSQHGWIIDDDSVSIKWLGSSPAPEEVLELISCLCKRTCKAEDCVCMQAQLKCTSLCTAKCNNMVADDEHVTLAVDMEEDDDDIDASDVEEDD